MSRTALLSRVETEIVVLKATKELIDSIVNFEVLSIGDSDPTETRFASTTHAKYFNIVLVDLLSGTDKRGIVQPRPYIAALRDICRTPSFDRNGSAESLRSATEALALWLEEEMVIEKVWLPTVWKETTLRMRRIELLKLAGNVCRHNFLRSAGIAEDARSLLARNHVQITLDQALLVLGDVYEWLHTHLFNYHASTIAEFLNNIRWGIYEYLQPEYRSSLVKEEWPMYRYTIPAEVVFAFAKECYWGLMNEVRSAPYMRRFVVHEVLKLRY